MRRLESAGVSRGIGIDLSKLSWTLDVNCADTISIQQHCHSIIGILLRRISILLMLVKPRAGQDWKQRYPYAMYSVRTAIESWRLVLMWHLMSYNLTITVIAYLLGKYAWGF